MPFTLNLAVLFACLHLCSATCTNLPIRLAGKMVSPMPDSGSPTCPPEGARKDILGELDKELDEIIDAQLPVFQQLSLPVHCPGYGWVRVTDFNLETNSSAECPGGWSRNNNGAPHCISGMTRGCRSANFSTNSLRYSQICGRVQGFQIGPTTGFSPSTGSNPKELDDAYLDGVSITRGSPRHHIWSFGAGYSSTTIPRTEAQEWMCPCFAETVMSVPSFVDESYFCNSGTAGHPDFMAVYHRNPLWDGQGCLPGSTCCGKGPYFFANLTESSCDHLEVRICTSESHDSRVDVGVNIVELYVR